MIPLALSREWRKESGEDWCISLHTIFPSSIEIHDSGCWCCICFILSNLIGVFLVASPLLNPSTTSKESDPNSICSLLQYHEQLDWCIPNIHGIIGSLHPWTRLVFHEQAPGGPDMSKLRSALLRQHDLGPFLESLKLSYQLYIIKEVNHIS